jgi:hypothetical protein
MVKEKAELFAEHLSEVFSPKIMIKTRKWNKA